MITSTDLVSSTLMGIVFGFLLSILVFYKTSKVLAKKMQKNNEPPPAMVQDSVKVMAYSLLGLVGIFGAGLGAWMGVLWSMIAIGLLTVLVIFLTLQKTKEKRKPRENGDSFEMLLNEVEKKNGQDFTRP